LGKHKVILPVLTYDYLTNNLSNGKPYDIVLKSHRGNVITNLSCDIGTEFKGQATGLQLYREITRAGISEGYIFVAPPSIYYSYKEYISIVPDLLMKYRKEFEDSVGIEADYNLCDKYNKVFLVNLNGSMNGSILVNQNELYLDYSSWLYPASEDGYKKKL